MYRLNLYRFADQEITTSYKFEAKADVKDATDKLSQFQATISNTENAYSSFVHALNSGSIKPDKVINPKSYENRITDLIVNKNHPAGSNLANLKDTILASKDSELSQLLSSEKWLPDKTGVVQGLQNKLDANENITINRNLMKSLQDVADAREHAAKKAKDEALSVKQLAKLKAQEVSQNSAISKPYSSEFMGFGSLGTASPIGAFSELTNKMSGTSYVDALSSSIPTLSGNLDKLAQSAKSTDDYLMRVKNTTTGTTVEIKEFSNEIGNGNNKVKLFNIDLSKSPELVKKLKNAFNSLSMVQMVYLWRTVKRVTTGLVEMVENAANFEESINLYRMSFGKFGIDATKWMNRITDALKLDPSDVMQYAGAFNNLLKGMGVASDTAYTMSTNLTQLTYDMASYLNISNSAAQAKIQSAMAGQSRAVASVGVATQMASLQELAHSLNIKKKVANMTQAEKTYLRYIQLMRSTTHMQGDLGKTMLTPANAVRTLKNQINLLSRAIGQVLTPIIMQVIPYIMAMTNVLTKLAQKIADFFGYKVTDVDYTTTFEDIGDALDGLGKDADGAGKKVRNSLAPFDELNQVMFESSKKGSGDDDGIVIPQLEKYVTGYDMLSKYTGDLVKRAEELEGTVTGLLKVLGVIAGVSVLGSIVIKIARIKEALTTLGITNALPAAIGAIKTGLTAITTALGGVWGVLGGIVLPIVNMIAGFVTIKDVSYNVTKSMGKMTNEGKQAVGLFGGWTAVIQILTTAAAALVNPLLGIATAVGFIATDIAAVESGKAKAIEEMVEKLRESAREKVFGEWTVSMEEWTEAFHGVNSEVRDFNSLMDQNKNSLQTAYSDFKVASDGVELLQLTFRANSNKISKEDVKKIKDSVSDMCTSTKDMIETNANTALMSFADTFKNTTQWTKEEQDKILADIKSYSEQQQLELKNAQDNITTTYDNAIKKRGYLTDEEYAYIEEQLAKIRDLTENQMSQNNATILRLKDSFANESKKLDENSYKEFNDALDGYQKEKKQKLDDQYTYELNKLATLYNENNGKYDQYLIEKKKLDDDYIAKEDALNNEIYGYRQALYDNLVELYGKIRDKTDTDSLATKEAIEKILVDAKIDPTSIDKFIGQYQDVGKGIITNLEDGVKKQAAVSTPSMWESIKNGFKTAVSKNPVKIGFTMGEVAAKPEAAKKGLSLALKTIWGFAEGGLPNSGDLFFANENGRAEYMASIGNRTAVVNQDQMVQTLASVITDAMANLGFGNNQKGDTIVYIGNKKVYEGQGEYQNRENDRYGTSVVRV